MGGRETRERVGGAVADRLTAYAELVRLPNLFTAPPDVVAGAALAAAVAGSTVGGAAAGSGAVDLRTLAGLGVASTLLYAAGTTLNDCFDAEVDAAERPTRPIPSGRVSRTAALTFGIALLAGGVGLAWLAGGVESGVVAGGVAVAVVAYDGVVKGGPAGFLAMGAARGLNVTLGLTAGASLAGLDPLAYAAPLVLAGYVAAVTYMATEEATTPRRGPVAAVGAAAVGAAVALPALLATLGAGSVAIALGAVATLAFLGHVARPLRAAYADPSPATVGPAVGACVLGIVALDAGIAVAAGPVWGVAAAAFALPAVALSRAFDVT